MHRGASLALAVVAAFVAGCTLGPLSGNGGSPGSAARDLVSSKYPTLVLEIDHPPGFGPNAEALSTLRTTLQQITGRDASRVQVVQDPSIPVESKRYTYREIETLEREHRDRQTGGDEAVLYILYVAGGSEDDTDDGKVLGAVYRGTSMVIFKGNIKANTASGPLSGKPEERFVERAVLVHEFGHAAGLVNLGTPMVRNHEDPDHRGHSSNPNSVMYWIVENTRGLFSTLSCVAGVQCGNDIPYTFDADDKADLQALKES